MWMIRLNIKSSSKQQNNVLKNVYPMQMFLRIRMSFIASYVYSYEEFVFMTDATAVQQNDSDRTKTQIIKRRIKKNK